MASIEELKNRIDLHDLAHKLGLKPQKGSDSKANRVYHAPHRKDASPSLSIFNGGRAWKDHTTGEGGSCIDLVMYVEGLPTVEDAMRRLHELYSIPLENPKAGEPKREKSTVEYIADRCLDDPKQAIEYLVEERKIDRAVAEHALMRKTIGFNTWTSTRVGEGEPGHGGPAVAFLVRSLNPGHVVAVDLRYLDAAKNGNVKTQCQGEKSGYGWTSDVGRLLKAQTVYIVESPINALSIDCCKIPRAAAFAIRGTGNADSIDLTFLRGKQVILAMDNDEPQPAELNGRPNPNAGIRAGLKAGWTLHERLTALDIPALMIDQADWEHNDVNDILKALGAEELRVVLSKIEPWLIPGLPGESRGGRSRLFLPSHHWYRYGYFRVKPDFTQVFSEKTERDADGNEKKIPTYKDVAGFRIAALSRVTIASPTATMTGDEDSQPRTLFAVSVQTARHGANLVRRVVEDEKLHNVDVWGRFGPIWDRAGFMRMVNILENAADIGARHAANFVGLCYREGALAVNEGPDCYFTNPEQQCPYYNLTFPSGPAADARRVIEAYQATFKGNAAAIALVWALGGHLKVLLGFWPHLQMQANKGAGKSTLIKRLERSTAFTMFSGQSLQTEFRLLTSISHTSHPVGWEELSARRQDVIDKAVAILQECYQYTVNRRGTDMTEFVLSAPVMLAGEDVPVRGLIGKLVRTKLTQKGPMMPEDLPRFPVRQWLEFLTELTPQRVRTLYEGMREKALASSRASGQDDGAVRMAGNYAAIVTAWLLLCEFAGMDPKAGGFLEDLKGAMNGHIEETSADREPWVWITEVLLHELARGQYRSPFRYDEIDGDTYLLVRTSEVMHHLSTSQNLKDTWNGLPVKSDRVYKDQLERAGVLCLDPATERPKSFERTCGGRRVAHMVALSVSKLKEFGLHAAIAVDANGNPQEDH